MNVLIAVLMLGIVASLGQALFAMSSGHGNSERMVKALAMRVGLSIALFILLMAGWHFNLITPTHMR